MYSIDYERIMLFVVCFCKLQSTPKYVKIIQLQCVSVPIFWEYYKSRLLRAAGMALQQVV